MENKKTSNPKKLNKIDINALDIKEKQKEDNFVKLTRPTIFGKKSLKWDGFIKVFFKWIDNLIWVWFNKK